MKPIVFNTVYYVTSSDPTEVVNPIAIRPACTNEAVFWEDTGRGTYFQYQDLHLNLQDYQKTPQPVPPEEFSFVAKNGHTYTLTKLTLALFNQEVRHKAAGHPLFSSDQELQTYYLQTNFYC